jgi:Ala-tRNA(Pro) deacylase
MPEKPTRRRKAGWRNGRADPEKPVPATPAELIAYLDGLGVAHASIDHPPLHTVEDSRVLRADIPDGHTKNLFVKEKKSRLYLLVLEEDASIDLKRVHEKIGGAGRVSFGGPELLEEVWGVKPGSVTPFGAINDTDGRVTVVLDAAMMRHARLNFHPLVNTRTTGLASADLVKFLRAAGHEPLIAPLACCTIIISIIKPLF